MSGYVNAVERESKALFSSKYGKHYREIVRSGTFSRSIKNRSEVDLLFNHKRNRKLGSTGTGNFSLHEDSIGLFAEATIDDEEVIERARRGELRGWSFGFVDKKENWDESNGQVKRYLTDIDLREVSILDCTPAYNAMSLEVRGGVLEQRQVKEEIRIVEDEEEKETSEDSKKEDEEEKDTEGTGENKEVEDSPVDDDKEEKEKQEEKEEQDDEVEEEELKEIEETLGRYKVILKLLKVKGGQYE